MGESGPREQDTRVSSAHVDVNTPLEFKSLVSIIIPAYNAERTIDATLDSARRQTYPNLEVIVVDDGSTDGTASVVRAHCELDPRVRLVSQPNAGVAAARNTGIEYAKGSLIAPLDADDLWQPAKIERQVTVFEHASDRLALVYSWSHRIDENDSIIEGQDITCEAGGNVYRDLLLRNFVGNGSNPLMRKEHVMIVGAYKRTCGISGCEDWNLYLALAEHYEFAVVREALVGYRTNITGLSSKLWSMIEAHENILNYNIERHPEIPDRVRRASMCGIARWLVSNKRDFLTSKESRRTLAAVVRRIPYLLIDPMFWWMILRYPFRRPEQIVAMLSSDYAARSRLQRLQKRLPFPADSRAADKI